MKLKTFLTSYLLFVVILFTTVTSISLYMSRSQMELLKSQSIREYQTIHTSLGRDMEALRERTPFQALSPEAIHSLMNSYVELYEEHFIGLALTTFPEEINSSDRIEISLIEDGNRHVFYVRSFLPIPFQNHRLEAHFDVTENIDSIQNIQQMLLLIFMVLSVISAISLHVILMRTFKPLESVAAASKKIANGNYQERIPIKGEGVLAEVAHDFNRMASEIEAQMGYLAQEATAKQQFVDNFAHEIRTPLTSIFGYAQLMQRVRLSEGEQIETVQIIMDEASHMEKIADSLLDLATLRDFVPVTESVPLEKLFEEIDSMLKPLSQEKKVRFSWETQVKHLEAQGDLLKSLVLNLVKNAINACQPEVGEVKLEAFASETGVQLLVTDNGSGIPPEELEKVLEPFYRIDKARSRQDGGTGLGLALCQQIAQVSNARITMKSTVGSGTQVQVTFYKSTTSCE